MPLAQTWPSLTRGCHYLLGPDAWLPGAAGTGVGCPCPGFHGVPEAAEHGQRLAGSCRCAGPVLRGCLGGPVACFGVTLLQMGLGMISSGKSMLSRIIDLRSLRGPFLQCSGHAATRSHPILTERCSTWASVSMQNLIVSAKDCWTYLCHFFLLETVLLDKSRLQTSMARCPPTNSSRLMRTRNFQARQSSLGTGTLSSSRAVTTGGSRLMELHWFGGQKHEAAAGLSRNCSSLTAKQH